jgi:predicted enzyme related to lactoylglutathione lyase
VGRGYALGASELVKSPSVADRVTCSISRGSGSQQSNNRLDLTSGRRVPLAARACVRQIAHTPTMKISEIAFACYPVTDMARARSFYEGILGLTAAMDHKMEDEQWVEYEIGAGTLAISNAPGIKPSKDGCSVALEVDDFNRAIAELRAANIELHFGPIETPVCHIAFIRDPDGNPIVIHKRKESHK